MSFNESLAILTSAWDYVGQAEHKAGVDADNVSLMVECLSSASRHVLLSGDWMTSEKSLREKFETGVRKCLMLGVGKKETVEGVLSMADKPWDSLRIKNLLTGKSELQQQVLSLVSTEGVDTVLLRTELLVEAGLDKPAYKFVSNIVTSLLADHIVFEAYVLTSKSGTLEHLVDTFIALSTALHHLSRLYKVLKLVGLEEVNKVYLPRFQSYNSPSDTKDGPPSGRCSRLFTPLVCSKVIKIINQWSMAGVAVKECPPQLQQVIIDRWLEANIETEAKLESSLPDIETLVSSANQTYFLYSLGISLWKKVAISDCLIISICLL